MVRPAPLATFLVVALTAGGCGVDPSSRSAPGPARAAAPAATPAPAPRAAQRQPPERRRARAVRARSLVPVGRFAEPVYLTAPPADPRRLFVVEKAGRIQVLRDGQALPTPFLDLRDVVATAGERGLLSMAFPPDYAGSGRFYVFLTDREGTLRVEEFTRQDDDRADRGSRRLVLAIAHGRFPNHNGGQLQFDRDGLLYVFTGDGGGVGDPLRTAQNRRSLLGKVLRIDPRGGGARPYRIPRDNPFRGGRGGRPEVVAYGLRNPWRASFDRRTGDLVLGDNGQERVEEVDFVRRGRGRGANFGWSVFEGSSRFRPGRARRHVRPVLEHPHPGFCSVIGGYVIRDPELGRFAGRYVYGDFCSGQLRTARLRAGRARGDRPLGLTVPTLGSFGEDAQGRVYAMSVRSGEVFRLSAVRCRP